MFALYAFESADNAVKEYEVARGPAHCSPTCGLSSADFLLPGGIGTGFDPALDEASYERSNGPVAVDDEDEARRGVKHAPSRPPTRST